MKQKKAFLTAKWEYLVMLNYRIPAEILTPFLPKGTELDLFEGHALASVVGFLFNDTKVLGIKWPFHTNFEEVNLRVYIKRFDGIKWKRGVAFISEIVPKHMITWMANGLYNEHYRTMPMKHTLHNENEYLQLNYEWQHQQQWNNLKVKALNRPTPIVEGSEAEFIFEHFWGYNQLNKNTTVEYGVEHPRWEVYPVTYHEYNCDVAAIYGKEFIPYLSAPPHSAMLAKGSAVTIRTPTFLKV
jgi:uncharacterized protein YqjF (DUF2071 family)